MSQDADAGLRLETRMKVRKIMSRPVISATPDSAVLEVASSMREHGIGFVPVVVSGRLIGTLTDRDLALSALLHPDTHCPLSVSDVISQGCISCLDKDSVETAGGILGDFQMRRIPVLDREGSLVGVLSLGDIAEQVSERLAGEILGEIVESR